MISFVKYLLFTALICLVMLSCEQRDSGDSKNDGKDWLGFNQSDIYPFTNTDAQPSNVYFKDFNSDGYLDVLLDGSICGQSSNGDYLRHSYIFVNDGTGHFGNAISFNKGSAHRIVTDVEDYNNDGYQDLLAGDYWGNGFKIYNGGANLSFTLNQSLSTSTHGGNSKFADLDNDGDLDIVSVSGGSGVPVKIHIFRNENGNFSRVNFYDFYGITTADGNWNYEFDQYNNVQVEDIDNDGLPDIFLNTHIGFVNAILKNNGNLNFEFNNPTYSDGPSYEQGVSYSWKQLIDFNNDGFMDLHDRDTQRVWFGSNSGTYNFTNGSYITLTEPLMRYRYDFNNDGLKDNFSYRSFNFKPFSFDLHFQVNLQESDNVYSSPFNFATSYPVFNYRDGLSDQPYGGYGMADLDNDGFIDVVAIGVDVDDRDSEFLEVFLNKGN